MQMPTLLMFCLLVGFMGMALGCPMADRNTPGTDSGASRCAPVLMGGIGGVYLAAEPGDLVVEIEKMDLNVADVETEMRIMLLGPDRSVLEDVRIPDDGLPTGAGPGPRQRVRLSTRVDRPGIYAVNVTVSHDTYGKRVSWSLRTNCRRYLIETARGHADRAHDEPIVLRSPERPGDVCWRPIVGELTIEVSDVPDAVSQLELFDADGDLLRSLPVRDGKAKATIEAATARDGRPWRLHLPQAQATLQVNGLTRWSADASQPKLCLWTESCDSWFALSDARWLLTPYSRTAFARPGERNHVRMKVRNDAPAVRTVDLRLEFPGDETWPAELSEHRLTLKPGESREITLICEAPEDGAVRTCWVRAAPVDDPHVSTYSTVRVHGRKHQTDRVVNTPIILQPYRHENELFGYEADFPTDWEMYVDIENRASVRTASGVATLRGARWENVAFEGAIRTPTGEAVECAPEVNRAKTKIAYDSDNDMYIVTARNDRDVLLHSNDGGHTFAMYDLGPRGRIDIEQYTGHNVPDAPPAILRAIRTDDGTGGIWRQVHDMTLMLFDKTDGGLEARQPVMISRQSLGVGMHSGLASAAVSCGSRIHIIWGEATDPDADAPGVPVYVVTYDRREGRLLGAPVLIGYGPPANDTHNRPSITIDSKGILHALTGTHGHPFAYARSLEPNTAHAGWTEAETIGEGLNQSYVGLVCSPNDTLHLVSRLWRRQTEPHPVGFHATLAYQRKRAGQPWERPHALLVAPFSNYSVFYHRLTIDRLGRLFLSYDYWSTYWFYRNDHLGRRRKTIMSSDGGETWKLLKTIDLQSEATSSGG